MLNKVLEYILEIFYQKIKNLKNKYKISYQHRLVDEFNYYKIYHKEKISKFYEIHKTDFEKTIHFADYRDTRKFSLKKSLENFKLLKYNQRDNRDKEKKVGGVEKNDGSDKLFLEFGVNKGYSARQFTEILSEFQIKLIGFDSFNGLVDSGFGAYYSKGSASMDGEIVKNVKNNKDLFLEVGLIQDTLTNFLKKNSSKKIAFCHIDVDTYETTKFILLAIKPFLLTGSIILFDEIHNFAGWEQGEYKALIEVFSPSEYSFICFSQNNYQASISIL